MVSSRFLSTRQDDRLEGSAAAVDQRHQFRQTKFRTPPTQPSVRQHQRSADEGKVDCGRQLNAAAITEQPPKRNADEAAAPPSRNRRGAGKCATARFVGPGLKPPSDQCEAEQARGVPAEGHRPPRSSERRWFRRASSLLVRTTD